ncbi:MAG: type 4a pilus biogenesis protein PilO [Nitrospinae bacterium]|nr:type 4a pilus biogenesis protein PilO [Nitrospinota bacterium]
MGDFKEKFLSILPYQMLLGLPVKARWGIVAGVPAILVAALFFTLIQSTLDDTQKIQDEYAKVAKEIKAKEELEAKLPEFILQIAALDAQVSDLRRQLPETKEIPNLLEQVSALGLKSGLEFVVFKPLPEVEKDFYSEVPVDVIVSGTFHSMLSFFDQVSKMPRIVTFTNVAIARGAKKTKVVTAAKGTPITATCKAVTYRFLEAKVDQNLEKKEEKKEEKKPDAAKK